MVPPFFLHYKSIISAGLYTGSPFHNAIIPPVSPPGRGDIMNWRDIRSIEALNQFQKWLEVLPWEKKEPILKEMTIYLEKIKEIDQKRPVEIKEALVKTRRPRRTRSR